MLGRLFRNNIRRSANFIRNVLFWLGQLSSSAVPHMLFNFEASSMAMFVVFRFEEQLLLVVKVSTGVGSFLTANLTSLSLSRGRPGDPFAGSTIHIRSESYQSDWLNQP